MIDCAMISVPPLFYSGPHIAPSLLKAYAKVKGYEVKCFNPTLDMVPMLTQEHLNQWPYNDFVDFDETYDMEGIITRWVDLWLSYEPRLIGLSTHVWASEFYLERICKVLRKKTDLPIIMGGPATIEIGDRALENGWIDYHVVGDGEEAFLNALEGKFDHPSINSNKPHAISNNEFTILPTPDYSDIDYERYRELDPKQNKIFLIGTRGCVFDCSFCNVPALMKYRYKDGIKFAHEVKESQVKFKPEWIEFADSLINGSLREYRKLITELARLNKEDPENKPKIIAFYRIRPMNQVEENDFKLMAESGFYRLKIGVESGSQQVRDHIGKTETDEEIMWTFEMCKKYGLKVNLLIIVGYPTETKADFELTMKMLRDIVANGYNDVVDRAVVNELYISTDTGLSKLIDELDIEGADSHTQWVRTLPNGEVLDMEERQRRLSVTIGYIKQHFGGKMMVFSESKTSLENNDNIKETKDAAPGGELD
jgi:radical SAM superfamily enzyme YgiQ (UPF0313 family)